MSYNIEVKLASKNGYFNPTEARSYYGRYDRSGFTVHWWNTREATPKGSHDNIVNYILGKASAGSGSVNYVLSDNKISMLVHPDNVAWASQSGNATTISCEFDPWLGDEGYKKGGWLINELEGRYGRTLQLYPHNYWFGTQCPGIISLDRLRQEANKWKSGAYNPAPPTPTPPPTPAPTITFAKITPRTFVANKAVTNLYNVNHSTWAAVGADVKATFKKGDQIDIYGVVKNSTLGAEWYVTKYSFEKSIPNGFSKADLDEYVAPTPPPVQDVIVTPITPTVMRYTLANAKLVNIKDMSIVKTFPLDTPMEIGGKATFNNMEYQLTKYATDNGTRQGFLVGDLKDTKEEVPNPDPTPPPVPEPPKPTDPEWVQNLRDITDTTAWFNKEQKLIDITTGQPALTNGMEKVFAQGEEFTYSALTITNGVEYRITDYSYQKKVFNGVPMTSLTLTPPGEPDIDPVPDNPDLIPKNVVIEFLQKIIDLIKAFIDGLRK